MRIADGSVLNLIRQWLKACAKEPNGVMAAGGPAGGAVLVANISKKSVSFTPDLGGRKVLT